MAKVIGTNILKALAGTTVVKDKETLLITHRVFIMSLLNYCTPILVATLSKTDLKERLVSQTVASGSPWSALVCIFMLKEHTNMLVTQFLISMTHHANIIAEPSMMTSTTRRASIKVTHTRHVQDTIACTTP